MCAPDQRKVSYFRLTAVSNLLGEPVQPKTSFVTSVSKTTGLRINNPFASRASSDQQRPPLRDWKFQETKSSSSCTAYLVYRDHVLMISSLKGAF